MMKKVQIWKKTNFPIDLFWKGKRKIVTVVIVATLLLLVFGQIDYSTTVSSAPNDDEETTGMFAGAGDDGTGEEGGGEGAGEGGGDGPLDGIAEAVGGAVEIVVDTIVDVVDDIHTVVQEPLTPILGFSQQLYAYKTHHMNKVIFPATALACCNNTNPATVLKSILPYGGNIIICYYDSSIGRWQYWYSSGAHEFKTVHPYVTYYVKVDHDCMLKLYCWV